MGSVLPDPKPGKLAVLGSYAYLRKLPAEDLHSIITHPRVELLVDSGAFTAFNAGQTIELNEYMEFLRKWATDVFGYLALDKVQDPAATEVNLRIMLSEGFKPIPVHVLGDDEQRMDELFSMSSWVACAGLRRPHRGAAPPEYVKQKMAWAKGRNVHWLGYTSNAMIRAFKPYSVDCANYKQASISGSTSFYLGGGTMKVANMTQWLERSDVGKSSHRQLRAAVAAVDFDPRILDFEQSWRSVSMKRVTMELSLRQWVLYQLDMRKHIGTRLFLAAIAGSVDVREVLESLTWAESKGLFGGTA